MKKFLKYVLATIVGLFVFTVILGFFGLITVAGLTAASAETPAVKDNSMLVLKLKGFIQERVTEDNPLVGLLEDDVPQVELDDIVKAIREAKQNANVKGIFIDADVVQFDSYATAAAIRCELTDFKKSGKWIYAYGMNFTQAGYYVSSVADSLFIATNGTLDFKGLGGKNAYLKGLYDKIGVNFQAVRVGKYKSYVEQQTSTSMSENDREQRMAYLNGMWTMLLKDIAAARKTTPEALNHVADDSIAVFADTRDYVATRLVDGSCYREQMHKKIKRRLGIADDAEPHICKLSTLAQLYKEPSDATDKVVVYYATGEIVDANVQGLFGEGCIEGNKMVSFLMDLGEDDHVKAVVLRVNSPGGSATASDNLAHEIAVLSEKKPVVVSMGGVAASGGYMMSAPADYIFAEPYTLTGSIGIFGMVPNASQLVGDKLGIAFDGAVTNRYTDYQTKLTVAQDNNAELAFLQSYVDRGYEQFLTVVSQGRHLSREAVHQVAQGRVWIAGDALNHRLVDKIGTLDDAIKKAAELAKLDDYSVQSAPAKKGWMDFLMKKIKVSASFDSRLKETLGTFYEPIMEAQRDAHRNRIQARMTDDVTF